MAIVTDPTIYGVSRSPRWAAVRKAHLLIEPACAACGADNPEVLNVHHVKPFHLYPALELEPANLITLCETPSTNCHLLIGHCRLWAAFNPRVRTDAAYVRRMLGRRATVAGRLTLPAARVADQL